jgi:antitoxin MazE
MEVDIIKIGNSRGIRIPKALLEQYQFNGKADLRMDKHGFFVQPVRKPREGWEDSIRKSIAKYGVDELVWPDDMQDEFDSEWTW